MGYGPTWGGRTGRFLAGFAGAPTGAAGPGEAARGPGGGDPRPGAAPGARGGDGEEGPSRRVAHPLHPSIQPRRLGTGTADVGSAGACTSPFRARATARSGRDLTKVGPRM